MIKQDTALRLAEEGFYVFPLVPDGKIPAFEGWQDAATRAADTICGWWERDPDYNIGIFTEKYGDTGHLVALDVDIKDGKAGAETFRGLRQTHDMPRTRTNLTASGGRHIIYAAHKPVRSSVERVGPGLDVRSAGGYIVGPGSMIRGMEYSSDWAALHYAPEWLIEKCGAPKARNSEVFPAIEETDTDAIIKRAVEWLKGGAPEAIQGRHGDQTTYTVAARLKDFGLSELAAVELLAHHWNEQKAHPTWAYEELAKKVSNAYAYGIEPLGVAAPQADFDEIEIPEEVKEQLTLGHLYSISAKDIEIDLDQVHLIEDLLSPETMSVLYGQSNTGKTFVALKLAYCIATGTPFQGRRVERGIVVYVAAEGGRNIFNRVAAMKLHFGNEDFPLEVVPCSVDLLRPEADTKHLIALIKKASEKHDGEVKMVVIDTLSRALAGGNENSPDDMGGFVTNVDKIRAETKSHLLTVHHSGKDQAKGARGHSSLRAATDTELEVGDNTLKATKQRDMEQGKAIGFDLTVVTLGRNRYDKIITTCVAEEFDPATREDFDNMPDPENEAIIKAKVLSAIEKAAAKMEPLSAETNAKTERKLRAAPKVREYSESEVCRALNALMDEGVVVEKKRKKVAGKWTPQGLYPTEKERDTVGTRFPAGTQLKGEKDE